jgi:hypothetical protein
MLKRNKRTCYYFSFFFCAFCFPIFSKGVLILQVDGRFDHGCARRAAHGSHGRALPLLQQLRVISRDSPISKHQKQNSSQKQQQDSKRDGHSIVWHVHLAVTRHAHNVRARTRATSTAQKKTSEQQPSSTKIA